MADASGGILRYTDVTVFERGQSFRIVLPALLHCCKRRTGVEYGEEVRDEY